MQPQTIKPYLRIITRSHSDPIIYEEKKKVLIKSRSTVFSQSEDKYKYLYQILKDNCSLIYLNQSLKSNKVHGQLILDNLHNLLQDYLPINECNPIPIQFTMNKDEFKSDFKSILRIIKKNIILPKHTLLIAYQKLINTIKNEQACKYCINEYIKLEKKQLQTFNDPSDLYDKLDQDHQQLQINLKELILEHGGPERLRQLNKQIKDLHELQKQRPRSIQTFILRTYIAKCSNTQVPQLPQSSDVIFPILIGLDIWKQLQHTVRIVFKKTAHEKLNEIEQIRNHFIDVETDTKNCLFLCKKYLKETGLNINHIHYHPNLNIKNQIKNGCHEILFQQQLKKYKDVLKLPLIELMDIINQYDNNELDNYRASIMYDKQFTDMHIENDQYCEMPITKWAHPEIAMIFMSNNIVDILTQNLYIKRSNLPEPLCEWRTEFQQIQQNIKTLHLAQVYILTISPYLKKEATINFNSIYHSLNDSNLTKTDTIGYILSKVSEKHHELCKRILNKNEQENHAVSKIIRNHFRTFLASAILNPTRYSNEDASSSREMRIYNATPELITIAKKIHAMVQVSWQQTRKFYTKNHDRNLNKIVTELLISDNTPLPLWVTPKIKRILTEFNCSKNSHMNLKVAKGFINEYLKEITEAWAPLSLSNEELIQFDQHFSQQPINENSLIEYSKDLVLKKISEFIIKHKPLLKTVTTNSKKTSTHYPQTIYSHDNINLIQLNNEFQARNQKNQVKMGDIQNIDTLKPTTLTRKKLESNMPIFNINNFCNRLSQTLLNQQSKRTTKQSFILIKKLETARFRIIEELKQTPLDPILFTLHWSQRSIESGYEQ